MPAINLSRDNPTANTVARRAVPNGAVFAYIKRDGRRSEKLYGSIGHNGKFFSVNLENGELASTQRKADRQVALVGGFTYDVNLLPDGQHRQTTRGSVASGEVFMVKGGKNLYLHMGEVDHGTYLSINAASRDYAKTDKATSNVTIVGTFRLNAKVAA